MANLILKCEKCNKERNLTRTMIYHIRNGRCLNRCKSCAEKGNKKRYLGIPYDKTLYNTPIYRSWYNMKTRCLNKKSPNYFGYGGRGIKICKEWLTFTGFLNDMQSSYKNGLSIERIDNHGNYCKDNCKWANSKEQANNTRKTERADKYTYKGETHRITEWAKLFNIKRSTLGMRLQHYNMPIDMALTKTL